jgi:ComF family protein
MPLARAAASCISCGRPFEGAVSVPRRCPECEALAPHWERGTTLLLYAGPGESLVRRLKFHGERCVLEDVRVFLRARSDALDILRGSVAVPVPLHAARLRERGFNQSEWLAEAFAAEAGAVCRNLLRRTRDTGTQTALTREDRRKNVRGAFRVGAWERVSPLCRYVLVDDVITTGATLDACARAMREAGAAQLAVLTLAHA